MENKYEQSLLTSMETLIDSALLKNNYDKTIQGTIVKNLDLNSGKYLIKYQDSSFEAFSADNNVIFSKDDLVYVLVPNGDMKKDKVIIGCVGGELIRNSNIHTNKETCLKIGKNFNNNKNSFSLCSYKKEQEKILYKKEENINQIQFNESDFLEYKKDAEVLILDFQLKTSLDRIQRLKGNYGVQIIAEFKDELDSITEKKLIFDINDINGNPYNINNFTAQLKIFENIKEIQRIIQISLFEKDFPNQEEEKEDDIFFSYFSIYAGRVLTEEELNSSRIDLITPQGNFFKIEDSQKTEKTIEASVKINGKQISSLEQEKCEFYWFKENSTINMNSEKYNLYGGNGWECLNDYSIITQQDLTTFVSWSPATDTLKILKSQMLAKEEKYKCVVIYQDQILENSISLKNYSASYSISIENTENNQFYYTYSYPSLICKVNNKEEQSSEYKYVWGVTNKESLFEPLAETTEENSRYEQLINQYNQLLDDIDKELVYKENVEEQLQTYEKEIEDFLYKQRVLNNQIININVGQILDYNIYKCSVYFQNNYIGTASYTIYNRINTNLQNYILKILNADIIYKYDEAGIAPTSESKENPIEIKPLDFALYTPQGEEINKELYKDCEIQWIPPSENTLINSYDTTTEKKFSYKIENQYSNEKNNNEIQLKVIFKGQTFWDKISLNLIKEGENGTNGTQYVCKIIPNSSENISVPIITNGNLNYTPLPSGKWFKVQLWKNGSKIFEDFDSGLSTEKSRVMVQWSVLKNKYNARWSDPSSILYNNGLFSYEKYFEEDKEGRDSPANIIKCTVTYNEKKYYATIPIITIKVNNGYNIKFKTGYLDVLYTSDGIKPFYKEEPFEIEVFRNLETLVDISRLNGNKGVSYFWRVCGQIYDLETKQWINAHFLNSNENNENVFEKNQKMFIPAESYDGECVTSGLECSVLSNASNQIIGKIHIPIYLYLNRYSNSALNDWDGNKIEINEEGSYILTPQTGAGKKEEDNSFTGMLMGTVKDALTNTQKIGLLGYNKGEQSIFFDAESGGVILGKGTNGQIIIDPKAQKSYLFSHNYWKEYNNKGFPVRYTEDNVSGEGLLIDLATPEIKYGNGNFLIDKNGNITCGDMITSKGILSQLTFSGHGMLGCNEEYDQWEEKEYTIKNDLVTNTLEEIYPSSVYAAPNQNLLPCFIPKGFQVFKAVISIEHSDMTNYIDAWYPGGEGKESFPSYVDESGDIKSSATDPIGIFFGDSSLLNSNFYIAGYETAIWEKAFKYEDEQLLESTSTGFRSVRDNLDDFGTTYSKIIDFSNMAKIKLKPGEVNYIDVRTLDPGRSMQLAPYTASTIVDSDSGLSSTYIGWKSTKGNRTRFRANEKGKQGYAQFIITILGYYDPKEAD